MESLNKQEACHKQLYLLEGDDPSGSSAAAGAAGVLSRVRNTVSLLKEEGLAATYWHYPGLTHGRCLMPPSGVLCCISLRLARAVSNGANTASPNGVLGEASLLTRCH